MNRKRYGGLPFFVKESVRVHKKDAETENGMDLLGYKKLSEDFKFLLENELEADVTLVVKGREFKVHKAILSARSKVFRRMFSACMRESIESTILIEDCEIVEIEGMLEYMYSGRTKLDASNAADLLCLAEKYDLDSLKYECEVYLANHLNLDNASSVLLLADLYMAKYLKEKAMEFFHRNKMNLSKVAAFNTLLKDNPSLLIELYLSISK